MSSTNHRILRQFYDALYKSYGPQHWWPGDGPTEIIVGAILTQNTNWRNVERAIVNLRRHRLLDWKALRNVPIDRLATLIRPAGYYNVKAARIKHFVDWIWRCHRGDINSLGRMPWRVLRRDLLSINGIGPETADSILLYALGKPSFVVDAYTRRLAARHGLAPPDAGYDELKHLFESGLPRNRKLFNEYHALIVAAGKRHCGPKAKCHGCPLETFEHDPEACHPTIRAQIAPRRPTRLRARRD